MLFRLLYFSILLALIENLISDESETTSLLKSLKSIINPFFCDASSPLISTFVFSDNFPLINRDAIIDSLLRLSKFNLVEYDNLSRENIKTASYVKITAAGKYYLKKLIFEFVYIDALALDTPISDISVFTTLMKRLNKTDSRHET